MANTKISQLPAATVVAGSDLIPVVQGGVTKQATPALLPISDAAAGELAAKAPLASPAFTGTPTINGSPISDSGAPLAPQFHGTRYTAYGHSFGQVQPTPNVWAGALYTARLRDLLHTDPALYVNRTVSGSEMADIATAAASNWTDGNGGLVTIMGNQNDVGHHTTQSTFKNAFRSFLSTMLGSTGKPPTVLVIHDVTITAAARAAFGNTTDADVATYNGYLDQVIAEFPTGWIVTADPIAAGWDPTTMTATDGQHPNERGMACITAACLTALAAAPYRPGLNLGVAGASILPAGTPPTALTITATPGDGQVVITKSGATGATSYAIYRSSTVTGSPIATSFPFTDTGRTNGTSYTYIATATNATGTVTSNTASATPAAAGGNTAFDLSTLRGTPAYGTGKFGSSLTSGVLTGATTGTARTIEAWLKGTGTDTRVAVRPSTGPGWLGFGMNGTVHGKPGTFADLEGGSGANDGAWHHVALTMDSGGTSRLFLDGVQVATGSADTAGLALDGATGVGGYGSDGSFDFTAVGGGSIDEVRISSTARYTANFTAPTAPFTPDGNTIALWHLNGDGTNSAA